MFLNVRTRFQRPAHARNGGANGQGDALKYIAIQRATGEFWPPRELGSAN
jgi:hypothetical protein